MYNGPYYRYDLQLLERTIKLAQEAAQQNATILHYAIKANHEEPILRKIKSGGMNVDCVSAGEIKAALENGWNANQIVFAGSGKTIREISYALQQNIFVIHCESVEEYHLIQELKQHISTSSKIALRLNPDLRVDTHENISTGEKHHKFGVSPQEALELVQLDGSICGFHVHVGSQILDMTYFESLSKKIRDFIDTLPSNYSFDYLNLGGGLGIDYEQPERNPIPNFEGWMSAIRTHLPTSLIEVIRLEPGRSIVGQCGTLIGEVQYMKHLDTSMPLAILDIGMTELMRPALYGARHKISAHHEAFNFASYRISGPSCESSDSFGSDYLLPILKRGDLVTIHSAGAYGSSMRLNYNLKETIPSRFINRPLETCFKVRNRKVA